MRDAKPTMTDRVYYTGADEGTSDVTVIHPKEKPTMTKKLHHYIKLLVMPLEIAQQV